MCNHAICAKLRALKNTRDGVGIALLNLYYKQYKTILLGHEKKGRYKGQYNMIGGSLEPVDRNCWVNGVIREGYQEAKIKLKEKDVMNAPVIIHSRTPIFCIYITSIKREDLNKKIKQDNQNPAIPWHDKEMSDVQYINIKTGQMIKKVGNNFAEQPVPISSYAQAVINKLNIAWK